MASRKSRDSDTTAKLGFEAKLWAAADALRNNMDAAEYKHVVLGLIFLKYISDAFEAKHAELESQRAQGADPEDPDEYRAANIFWVPPEARWQYLKSMAPQPTIGQLVDDAMSAIERDNTSLKGVLPKDYARPGLDKQRLGQLINLVSDIALGSPADRAKDTLGRVYECFLEARASPPARGPRATACRTGRPSSPRCWRTAFSAEFRDFAIQSMTGSSGRQRVPAESLSHFHVAVAPDVVAEKFGRPIAPLFDRARKAVGESRALSALRDTLLAKLISGELRIRRAQSVVERSTA
jgi:hypothetical protein